MNGAGVQRRALCTLVLVVVAIATAAEGALAAPAGWSSPQDLSDNFEVGFLEDGALNHPDVDVSGSGDAVAIWRRQEQLPDLSYLEDMWTSDRPLGGTWSSPRFVGTGNGDGSDPKVATNAGTTVIAWASGENIVARVRRGGGSYSNEKSFGAGTDVQVGVDDSGAVFVLWASSGIKAARNTAAGWSATKTISTSPTAQAPDLAVSGGGDAVATWKAQDGIRVTEFTPGAGWTTHYLVGPGGIRPSVATNDAGQVVLAWALEAPPPVFPGELPTQSVQAKIGSIRGGLGPAQRISDDIAYDIWLQEPTPATAMGARGYAAVAWNRAVYAGAQSTVQVATAHPPGGWSYPQNLAVPVSSPKPSLAVLPDGSAIAVWRGGSAAVRPADQADTDPSRWGPPFVLSNPGAEVNNPDVAADDAGRVHVLWADTSRPQTRYDDRLGFMAVQAVSFGLPGSPPAPLSPAPPGLPAPVGPSAPPKAATAGGVAPKKVSTTLARPGATTVLKRGTLYLRITVKLPKKLAGRTLVIQRRVGRKVLRLGTVRIPANGRITKLVALDTNSNAGAAGVRSASKIQVRITVAKIKGRPALSSPFRVVAV